MESNTPNTKVLAISELEAELLARKQQLIEQTEAYSTLKILHATRAGCHNCIHHATIGITSVTHYCKNLSKVVRTDNICIRHISRKVR